LVTIVSEQDSPRLRYILSVVFNQWLHEDFVLVNPTQGFKTTEVNLVYGHTDFPELISIPNAGLLFETGMNKDFQTPPFHQFDNNWVLFPTADSDYDLNFDFFSAAFWFLSRYEEYFDFETDKHGRFPHEKSFSFQQNVLMRPLVDEWLRTFLDLIRTKGGVQLNTKPFERRPTYDLDLSWAFKNRGKKLVLGGLFKDLVFNPRRAIDRLKVLSHWREDPFDSFSRIEKLHRDTGLACLWFVLCAKNNSAFDRHALPNSDAQKKLIKQLSKYADIGVHPSYFSSEKKELLEEEKTILEDILNPAPIEKSRQHYIRFCIPKTPEQLLGAGLKEDYSMGFARHAGFRAGTSRAFSFYHLHEEQETNLTLYPFYFMDTTARFEMNLTSEDAFNLLEDLTQKIKAVNGLAISIFHNFSLGRSSDWEGWWWLYAKHIQKWGAIA